MCGGDMLKHDYDENPDMTFEKWVNEQEGQVRELIKECGGRIILFDNNTKDEQDKKDQLDKLIQVVDNLSAGGERYTDKHFEEAKATRDKILEEAKETIIGDKHLMEINLIFQKLEKIRNGHHKTPNRKLEKLKKRCQEVIKELKSGDKTTSTINSLMESVYSLNRMIEIEIQFNEKINKERTENIKHKEFTKKRHEEEIEQIYTEFSKTLSESNQGGEKRKEKEIKQLLKKEIEELKQKIQDGCSRESVKKRIEQMEFDKPLSDIPKQARAKESRIETNQCVFSTQDEMEPKIQHGYSKESVKDKIKRMEIAHKPLNDIQKQTIVKDTSYKSNKQVSNHGEISAACFQHGYFTESDKKNVGCMEFNKKLIDVQNQMIAKKNKIETKKQEYFSPQDEMAQKMITLPKESTLKSATNFQHGYSTESDRQNFERMEFNKYLIDVRKEKIAKEKKVEFAKQECSQQEEMVKRVINLPTDSTSRGLLRKESIFRSQLADILSRQAQEENKIKIEEEKLRKEEIEERQKLNRETVQIEEKYRAVEDENNDNFFSKVFKKVKNWFVSLFK